MNETENQINDRLYSQIAERADNRIETALNDLIMAFRESQEYVKYQEIRARVHEDPKLEEQIHTYRKMIYEVQNSAENRDMYKETERLERDGEGFRKNPLVREYLAAELAFCRVFKHINWAIIQNIDFDLGFID